MEDFKTTGIAVALTAVGAVIGALTTAVVSILNTRRQNRQADRKDAMDELYKLLAEVKTDRDVYCKERNEMRDRFTARDLDASRLHKRVLELKERLRRHENVDDEEGDEDGSHPSG